MANLANVLNTIRSNATTEYQELVPVATQTNIAAVGNPILLYQNIQNQFLSALVNKIAFQVIHNKQLSNPLSVLKRGTIPLGSDIEEIFTNPAEAETFDPTGATLLTVKKADTKTLYHRMNRQDYFRVSVSRAQLQTAFTSYENLEALINTIVQTLYSGDNLAEFVLMKNLIADSVINSRVKTATVTEPTDEATGKAFIKAVQNASSYMEFPGDEFNIYPVTTWTPAADQILIIRADIINSIGVDVLAAAFNMDKVQLLQNLVKVDSFGAASNVIALLADKSFFQIYDNHSELTEFYNPQGLTWTYFWHHWQTYSISTFANAVAFVLADYDIVAFDSIDAISGNSYANGGAVTAALLALHPYVYADSGKVKVPVTTWVDTDTFNGGANDSYTFTATLGTLPYGVTNTTGGAVTATIEVVVDDN